MDFYHMVVRGAAAYSPFHRSKTHLVYTTDDLRIGFVDRIHFFGRAHPENRAYALPIGKVGLASRPVYPGLAADLLQRPSWQSRARSRPLSIHGLRLRDFHLQFKISARGR